MSLSRRDLLSSITAVSVSALLVAHARPAMAQPTSVASSGAPLRLPLHEFVQNQTLLDALRRGVEVMRSRPPSDPRSWFFQSAVHAVKDGLLADAILQDFRVARVDQKTFWNKCPHFPGVNSADFLPWHRAYLYYFERILRDAAQEPALAVPYWDYSNPKSDDLTKDPELNKRLDSRLFPRAFASQFLDPRENTQPNSLYHRNRESAFAQGLFDLRGATVDISRAMDAPVFFSLSGNGFGGDSESSSAGLVEQQPHNGIHFAVGARSRTLQARWRTYPPQHSIQSFGFTTQTLIGCG